MRPGHIQNKLYFRNKEFNLYYFNFCNMGSHEQETRYMACLPQKLNYVKMSKSDEESS